MKNNLLRLFFFCSILLSTASLRAQYVAIPDTNFGVWLSTHSYPTSGNSLSGWTLDTTYISGVQFLDCSSSNIHDLTGITYFRNLETLIATGNQMTSLPALPGNLLQFYCSENHLNSLSALPPLLTQLYCGYNNLSSLPSLPSSLTDLDCTANAITTLPPLPASLGTLSCPYNLLTTLPSLPTALGGLWCHYNRLTSLPVLPDSLVELICADNQLTSLPAIPAKVLDITCTANHLTSLPVLPNTLVNLWCDSNQLAGLLTLPPSLTSLVCNENPMLSCLSRIYRNYLDHFYISHTHIICLPNRVGAGQYDIDPGTLPLCDQASGCDFYYNISGNVHQDTSVSCQTDSLHPGSPVSYIKVLLKHNGQVLKQFYTYGFGDYSFTTDSLISYQVEIDTTQLSFTVACPSGGVRMVSLNQADSIEDHQDFGLICPVSPDYAALSIVGSARIGTIDPVHITAGNRTLLHGVHCSTGVSGIVTVTYSGAAQYTGPDAGALTPDVVSGNTLTYHVADINTLNLNSFSILLYIDSTAVLGSQVCITTIISASVPDNNSLNDTLTECIMVHNSHDPNLKDVYPTELAPNSDWLTYTIHFQNTGNDTAYTVIVRDTLSQNVLPETFQYVASSYTAAVQLSGNAMTFTFPKIDLVDSATNPALSEGWIQYKVRTKAGLPVHTQVKNTAYIYFDANAAIVTNTAISTVDTLAAPLAVAMYPGATTLCLYPDPNKGIFTLLSSHVINGEYMIYDMTGRLIAHGTITTDAQNINVQGLAKGVYTLAVKNNKGISPIRFTVD